MTDTLPPSNVKAASTTDDVRRAVGRAESRAESRAERRAEAFRGFTDREPTERRDGLDLAEDDQRDRLEPFTPSVLAIRWATTALSLSLAASAFAEADAIVVFGVVVILANAIIRSIVPQHDHGGDRAVAEVIAELAVHVLLVTLTGLWDSPLLFSLMSTVVIAGFARGFAFGLRIAATSAIAVTTGVVLTSSELAIDLVNAVRWSAVLLLVGVVAGYGRRISGEADRQHSIALGRMNRLADANALLFNLHRIAQTLPASLNKDEALDSTISRLRSLVTFDSAAILTLDESDGNWLVARRQAMAIGQILELSEMPGPVRRAIATNAVIVSDDLSIDGPGFNQHSQSAVYAPLMARGVLIGVLCIEARDDHYFSARDIEVLRRYVEPAALAIDNARWFARLRTIGADEERTRIARDLHDRIGQSLAYLGFEMDRVIRRDENDEPVADMLQQLNADIRGVTGEVRETLYDLRTSVGSEKDFARTITEFANRVAERSSITIELDCEGSHRLPIIQERELWRIAQESLINIERHARASLVEIKWRSDGTNALLSIADNGVGFPVGKTGRQDSYGLLGMRERASSIGATLELSSSPGEGTTVRCFLAQG